MRLYTFFPDSISFFSFVRLVVHFIDWNHPTTIIRVLSFCAVALLSLTTIRYSAGKDGEEEEEPVAADDTWPVINTPRE